MLEERLEQRHKATPAAAAVLAAAGAPAVPAAKKLAEADRDDSAVARAEMAEADRDAALARAEAAETALAGLKATLAYLSK